MKLAENEGESFWEGMFEELKSRGLRGVKLVISDGHKGIKAAVEKSFMRASWQMCHVHFVRDVLRKVPKKRWKELSRRLKEALRSVEAMQKLIRELEYDLYNYQAFVVGHWGRIRTTNILERVNKELKRRSRVIGAFPSDESLIGLAVVILMDINEEWITGRRYINMEGYGL